MAKRFPAQIGSWKVNGNGSYSHGGLLDLLRKSIAQTLSRCYSPGILLSGGVDSSLLAILANEIRHVPCFTIGTNMDHPDVRAAMQLCKERGFDHYIYIPSKDSKQKALSRLTDPFPGDEGVLLALEFASRFCGGLMATDGIDEQMGGYWWHIHRNDQFPSREQAFEHFWEKLEPEHLMPMFESAQMVDIDLYWVYLYPEVIDYIAQIPLQERVRSGTGKSFWKEAARLAGVPEWVLNRPKRGFVHALSG